MQQSPPKKPLITLHQKENFMMEPTTIVIHWTQIFTASLSFAASSTLAFKIPRAAGHLSTPYRRLIFGISIADMFQSFALATGPFLAPKEYYSSHYWAIGNKLSCDINGAMLTMGSTAVPMYTCGLCMYFLFKMNHNMTDKIFLQDKEKKLHIFIISWNILSTIAALCTGGINSVPGGNVCFIQHKVGSNDVGSLYLAIITSYGPVLICLVIIIHCMIRLCLKFTRQAKKNRMHRFSGSRNATEDGTSQRRHSVSFASSWRSTSSNVLTSRSERSSRRRAKDMVIQASSYIAAFIVTYIWVYIVALLRLLGCDVSFGMSLLLVFCFPLGGILNILVYTRPKVATVRRHCPQLTRIRALWEVILAGGDVPPQFSARRRNRTKKPALRRSYFDKYHELDKTDLIQGNISEVPNSHFGGNDPLQRLVEEPLDSLAVRSNDRNEAVISDPLQRLEEEHLDSLAVRSIDRNEAIISDEKLCELERGV